ncbi:hypothetical protein BP5796_03887 [Coleophoma crateriformis]|uniref:Uncharacterized protein n=1 Tax=Coleophoma crateriformis TaxID=565419 RepID=A0A3D8SH15_9HELO|nr:hypothetical protein BP5796_03887 [Coleophoma crateriformis]
MQDTNHFKGTYIIVIVAVNTFAQIEDTIVASTDVVFRTKEAKSLGIWNLTAETAMLTTLWGIKASFLITYHRLTQLRTLNKVVQGTAVYCAIGYVAVMVCLYAGFCHPFLEYFVEEPSNSHSVFNLGEIQHLPAQFQRVIRSAYHVYSNVTDGYLTNGMAKEAHNLLSFLPWYIRSDLRKPYQVLRIYITELPLGSVIIGTSYKMVGSSSSAGSAPPVPEVACYEFDKTPSAGYRRDLEI